MLIAGPEICHVDRCPHGCTYDTGCKGIELRRRFVAAPALCQNCGKTIAEHDRLLRCNADGEPAAHHPEGEQR